VGAEHGEVAPVVAGIGAFLFVGVLVFFIDDDDAEIGEGGKDGTARADDDFGFAAADAVPLVEAFALGEVGVENGDLILDRGEAGFEPLDGLRGEGNLGQEDKHAFPLVDAVLGGLEVDFCFP